MYVEACETLNKTTSNYALFQMFAAAVFDLFQHFIWRNQCSFQTAVPARRLNQPTERFWNDGRSNYFDQETDRLLLRPITIGANIAMNQSEFLAITCNLLKGREKSLINVAIRLGFSFPLVEKLGRYFKNNWEGQQWQSRLFPSTEIFD